MPLTSLPKPATFDLNAARADRAADGAKWLPEDALYAASLAMAQEPASVACIIAWYTRLPNGNLKLNYRVHQERPRQAMGLASDLMMVDLGSPV